MNDYQMDFLKQSVLGRDVKMNNPDEVIIRCIELADNDMMSGGRFIAKEFKKDKNARVKGIKQLLIDNA